VRKERLTSLAEAEKALLWTAPVNALLAANMVGRYVNVDGNEERRELFECAIGKWFKRIELTIGREQSFSCGVESCGGFRVYADLRLNYLREGHCFLDPT
jgi:hypothetical protein